MVNTEDTMIHVIPVIAVCRGDWDDDESMCGGAGIVIAIDRWCYWGVERSGERRVKTTRGQSPDETREKRRERASAVNQPNWRVSCVESQQL